MQNLPNRNFSVVVYRKNVRGGRFLYQMYLRYSVSDHLPYHYP